MRILEALYPDEAEEIAIRREAIERGYEMIYRWDMERIFEGYDVMTEEESMEVWDTLDMFDALSRCVEKSNSKELRENYFSKFKGYDGNSESKYLAFTLYTIEKLDRFTYMKSHTNGRWNSHAPMRDTYGRMLDEWLKVPRDRRLQLNEAEAIAILAMAVHPEHR
jgi:uncharacterized protein YfbU (UPF0304 family)